MVMHTQRTHMHASDATFSWPCDAQLSLDHTHAQLPSCIHLAYVDTHEDRPQKP